jgi:glycosyltransferase involved in cell wall biosynthesis
VTSHGDGDDVLSSHAAPQVSIVIPIHDEAAFLESAISRLRRETQARGWSYEIILAEHGSRDHTAPIARELSSKGHDLRVLSIARRNYGEALKVAILAARGQFVICEDVAICDAEFHLRAIDLLAQRTVDLVTGSEGNSGAPADRGLFARVASRFYVWLLRVLVGFRGSDTHGLKVFRRATVIPIVRRCVSDKEVFATELVVRAQRAGLAVREIPMTVAPRRTASIPWLKRVIEAIVELTLLTWYIRFP